MIVNIKYESKPMDEETKKPEKPVLPEQASEQAEIST